MLMTSNGRHRKPRQAPAAVVTVAATGAGMTLPFLAASGAQAADNVTWRAVALCESGDVWSSNTGNGFYGGLQISQRTWAEYGGQEYAERPDLAGIDEQMAVANKILAALGPDAWPGCAERAGLKGHEPSASLSSTGSTLGDILSPALGESKSKSTGTSTSTSDSKNPGDGSGDGSGAASSTPSSSSPSSPSSSVSTPFGSLSAAHPGSQTYPPGETYPRQPQGQPEPQPQSEPQSESESQPEAESAWGVLTRDELPQRGSTFADGSGHAVSYRVRPGDSLCVIAAEQGVRWRELYHENRTQIGHDPRLIHPGQYLMVES